MKTRFSTRTWAVYPTILSVLAIFATCGAASAQDRAVAGGVDPNTTSLDSATLTDAALNDPGYIPGGQFPQAATYEESVLTGHGQQFQGAGRMLQGIGQGYYLMAQGRIANEHAREMYLDNVLKHAETYWQRKAIHQNGQEMARGQRPTAEDLARFAADRAPDGLKVTDFDPASGRFNWPEALLGPEFESHRNAIEFVVKRDGIGARGVEALAEQMEAKLKAQVAFMDPADYVAAKNFVTGLEVESSATPRRVETIAARPAAKAIARR
jgi:hypothetical protein